MSWMNRYDVEDAARQFEDDPVLGPATQTLLNLMHWTDENSDGWPYWTKPSRAALSLQGLIQRAQESQRKHGVVLTEVVSAADVRKAYAPIKAFFTRFANRMAAPSARQEYLDTVERVVVPL